MSAIPFTGEEMTCVMCGKVQKSDPAVQSQWRLIKLNGQTFYVCPIHFPDNTKPTSKKFADAYYKVLQKCLSKVREVKP